MLAMCGAPSSDGSAGWKSLNGEVAARMSTTDKGSRPTPTEVNRYLLQRWSELMKPIRHRFVEAGLVGKSFTEKAPDMPWERLNYCFAEDGTLKFDFDSKEDTGQTIIHYVDLETGYRAFADGNFDYMKAFEEGKFRIEPSAEDALRMEPLMPEMAEAFRKAMVDTEKKFNVKLPRY